MLLFPSALVVFFAVAATALPFYPDSSLCVSACDRSVGQVNFDDDLDCDGLYAKSIFACAAVYCTQHEIESGFPVVNKSCHQAGLSLPPYARTTEATTLISKADIDQDFSSIVVPDRQFHALAYKTEYAYNRAMTLNWVAAWSVEAYWALILFVATVARVITLATKSHAIPAKLSDANNDPGRKQPLLARTNNWIHRAILTPYILQNRQFPSGPIPTRLEFLILLVHALLNLAFCFPGYHISADSLLDWKTVPVQYARYIANRLGTVALGNLPVVWLFALRNNPFIWLTGWPYSTFSQFHRWVARLTAIEMLGHSLAYTAAYHFQHKYRKSMVEQWFFTGVIAIVLVGVLVTLSARILRRRAYDLFLLIHISLAAAALVVIKLHLAGLPDKGNFFAFVWVCVGFWSLDRVMRLARVAYHSAIPLAQGVKAVATLDPDSGIIRLDASEFFKGKSSPPAGSFYYIYDIARAKGYENHPFTICSWNSPNSTDCQKQSFLIRPQDGYTGYLRDKLSRTGTDKSCRLTILLEGPYDGGILLDGHSDVLMIVGGSGVSAAISQAYSLLNSRQSRLHLIWIVREKAFVDNILDQELKSLVEHPDASLDIYVTGVSASTPVETEKTLAQVADHIHAGRPDTADIIAEARVTAGRSLAVFCSGPAGLREDCRRIVPALMREPGVDIRLYEERFDW